MTDIVPPPAFEDAVQKLPPHQNPFGDQCALPRQVQDVMFHYNVHKDDVALLVAEGFDDAKLFREANPDGDSEQRELYMAAVEDQITGLLRKRKMKQAFRRLLSPDIYSAVTPAAPPAKKPRTAAASANIPVAPSALGASSSNVASTPASTSGVAPVSKTSSASKVDSNDDDDDGDGADADNSDDKDDKEAKTSSRNDLDSLFEDVKNEVRFSLCGVVVAPFRDSALLLHFAGL